MSEPKDRLGVPDEPPDGGWQAWTNVACGSIVAFVTFGLITAFGELESYYLSHQLSDYTRPQVAWIAAIQIWAVLMFAMLFGRWFDSHGIRLLLVAGWMCLTVSLVGVAFSHEYYQFFLSHLLYGFGSCMMFAPSMATAGQWFNKKRVTAMGTVLAGTGLGGVVYPIMIAQLLSRTSFRNTILSVMGLTSGLLLPCVFLLRPRVPTRPMPPWRDIAKPWKDITFVLIFTGSTIIGFNLFSPFFDIPKYASSNTPNATIIAYSITLAQTGTTIGRFSGGLLADRFGIWPVFLSFGFGTGISLLTFWVPPVGSGGVVVGLLLFGVLQGAWITNVTGMIASLSPPDELGLRLGLIITSWAIPCVLGPFFSDLILESSASHGRYTLAGVFATLTWITGATVMGFTKLIDYRRARQRVEA